MYHPFLIRYNLNHLLQKSYKNMVFTTNISNNQASSANSLSEFALEQE
jgi:hypothetical protein